MSSKPWVHRCQKVIPRDEGFCTEIRKRRAYNNSTRSGTQSQIPLQVHQEVKCYRQMQDVSQPTRKYKSHHIRMSKTGGKKYHNRHIQVAVQLHLDIYKHYDINWNCQTGMTTIWNTSL